MSNRGIAAWLAIGMAMVSARSAWADIALEVGPFNTPYRSDSSAVGLYALGAAGGSPSWLLAVGRAIQAESVTTLALLGPVAAGTLQTSVPVLSDYRAGAVATSATPEPMAVVVGSQTKDHLVSYGLEVFAGTPLRSRYRRTLPPINSPKAATLTRVASLSDFDVAIATGVDLTLWKANATGPAWYVSDTANALATLPATATLPARLVATGADVAIRRVDDGQVLWRSPAAAGRKILVGAIRAGVAPQFVVLGTNGDVAAFASDPPALLWHKVDANADDIAFGDRDGDGMQDIAVATRDGKLLWLNGNGAQVGSAATLAYPAAQVAVAKVDAAAARVISIGTGYTGAQLQVRSLNLTTTVASVDAAAGPFDRIAIGDLDGDGREQMASLAAIPWGWTPSPASDSGRLAIHDLATGARLWSSAIPAGLGPTASDILFDVAIGRVQPGVGRQVVVLGLDRDRYAPVLAVVDGTTRALLRRQQVDVGAERKPTHVRLVDIDGDGIAEIVLVSAPYLSGATGVRVHVLRADSLAPLWTSPVLTPKWPATSVATRPAGDGGPDRLLLTVAQAGAWSIDLAARLVDYSVPADAPAAAWLPGATPAGRIGVLDAAGPALLVVDAASGAEIDRLALPDGTYRALAAVPGDVDRVVLADDDHLQAWNLASRRQESASPRLAQPAGNGTLLARANGTGATFYVGDGVGVWALRAVPFEPLIFANGFEP